MRTTIHRRLRSILHKHIRATENKGLLSTVLPEDWSFATKTKKALANAMCAGCGKRPDTLDPLPDGWSWDTMEPTNNWLWCPECPPPKGPPS